MYFVAVHWFLVAYSSSYSSVINCELFGLISVVLLFFLVLLPAVFHSSSSAFASVEYHRGALSCVLSPNLFTVPHVSSLLLLVVSF